MRAWERQHVRLGKGLAVPEIEPTLPQTPRFPQHEDPPLHQIGRFELIREIGRGGMGQVFLGRDTKLGRRVAIKFLLDDDADFAQRFLVEARATARCTHENIVTIFEVGEHEGSPYMVLEYLEGKTLAQVIDEKRPSVRQFVELMIPVARALERAHAHGIVHRDLKPGNIFVTDRGQVKVLDFGVARFVKPTTNPSRAASHSDVSGEDPIGSLVGTLAYMSPEQWGIDEIDHQSDLWALGVMFWRALVAAHPAGTMGPAVGVVLTDLDTPLPSLASEDPTIPREVVAVVDRCLQKRKSARYQRASEIASDLHAWLAPRSTSDAAVSRPARVRRIGCTLLFRSRERAAHRARAARDATAARGDRSVRRRQVVVRPCRPRSGLARDRRVGRPRAAPRAVAVAPARNHHPGGRGHRRRHGRAHGQARGRAGPVRRDAAQRGGSQQASRAGRRGSARGGLHAVRERRGPAHVPGIVDRRRRRSDVVGARRVIDARGLSRSPRSARAHPGRAVAWPLLPPDRENLRETLLRPAELAGYAFEDPAIVDDMLQTATSRGALPLLSFAAMRLWEGRDRTRRLLTVAAYERMGKVGGAFARHADQVVAAVPPQSQQLLRAIVTRLVTADGTRAVVDHDDLLSLQGDRRAAERILDQLVAARLIQMHSDDDGTTVEIVHEMLITEWPTLRRWLEDSHVLRGFLEELGQAARQWAARGKPADLVWRGATAQEALGQVRRHVLDLSAIEREFVTAIDATAKRGRRRRVIAFASIISALALVIAGGSVALLRIKAAESDAIRKASELELALAQTDEEQRQRLAAENVARHASKAESLTKDQLVVLNQNLEQKLRELGTANERVRREEERARAEEQRAVSNERRARDEEVRAKKATEAAQAAKREAERRLAEKQAEVDRLKKQMKDIINVDLTGGRK